MNGASDTNSIQRQSLETAPPDNLLVPIMSPKSTLVTKNNTTTTNGMTNREANPYRSKKKSEACVAIELTSTGNLH